MVEAQLICEALVREIRDAERWSAVVEAWEALLKVRHMARDMERELEHLGAGATQQPPAHDDAFEDAVIAWCDGKGPLPTMPKDHDD